MKEIVVMKSWKDKAVKVDSIRRKARDIHKMVSEQKIYGGDGSEARRWRSYEFVDGTTAKLYEVVDEDGVDKSYAVVEREGEEDAVLDVEDFEELLVRARAAGYLRS